MSKAPVRSACLGMLADIARPESDALDVVTASSVHYSCPPANWPVNVLYDDGGRIGQGYGATQHH
jgi:hypothetical protein